MEKIRIEDPIPEPANPQRNHSQPMITSKPTEQIIQERISKLRIPKRFRSKKLIELKEIDKEIKKGFDAVKAGKSLYITGSNGSGKTHLAVILLKIWAETVKETIEPWETSTITGFFLPCIEFFLQLKGTFGTDQPEQSIIEKYSDYTMLCIDDLGVEKSSEWSRQSMFALIDRRYRDCKQTIITSNLKLSDLADQLDNRIASRIVEMGTVIDLGNIDHRLQYIGHEGPSRSIVRQRWRPARAKGLKEAAHDKPLGEIVDPGAFKSF